MPVCSGHKKRYQWILSLTQEVKRLENTNVQIYYGDGRGKTSSALGQCIRSAGQGKQVIIVQFLKGKDPGEISFVKRLEPEIKLFRFEKTDRFYADLSDEEKAEQDANIRNGMNYAKKVIDTRGCDVLVLDEVLGLIDNGIVKTEELISLINATSGDMELIITGRNLPKELLQIAGEIYEVKAVKVDSQLVEPHNS